MPMQRLGYHIEPEKYSSSLLHPEVHIDISCNVTYCVLPEWLRNKWMWKTVQYADKTLLHIFFLIKCLKNQNDFQGPPFWIVLRKTFVCSVFFTLQQHSSLVFVNDFCWHVEKYSCQCRRLQTIRLWLWRHGVWWFWNMQDCPPDIHGAKHHQQVQSFLRSRRG